LLPISIQRIFSDRVLGRAPLLLMKLAASPHLQLEGGFFQDFILIEVLLILGFDFSGGSPLRYHLRLRLGCGGCWAGCCFVNEDEGLRPMLFEESLAHLFLLQCLLLRWDRQHLLLLKLLADP